MTLSTISKMSDSKNKIAAQLIKAEMLGDHVKVERLKRELSTFPSESCLPQKSSEKRSRPKDGPSASHKRPQDQRVKKFVDANPSLHNMFISEKSISARDEARMFVKTSLKFARDDMETKYFSQEIDDSQVILNRRKRHKMGPSHETESVSESYYQADDTRQDNHKCVRCIERCPKHLVIDRTDNTFMFLPDTQPFMTDMSNVVIRNRDHVCSSLVSASDAHKHDVDKLIANIRRCWASKGLRLIVMETYFKSREAHPGEVVSCGQHFQVYCLPIKDKYYERARMGFKQALQDTGQEWSLNKKIVTIDGRRVYRCLPNGLSYFWICFDDTTNGFGHVIEEERSFSRYFGFKVLSDLFNKEFSMVRLNQQDDYKAQFDRSRNFKLQYFNEDDADKG